MRLRDWLESSGHAKGDCFFCGRETTRGGYWFGSNATGADTAVIVVCPDCVRPLGQLAADAFEDGRRAPRYRDSDHDGLRELERGYWYGLACARRTPRKDWREE
jgi:hypothetical protein